MLGAAGLPCAPVQTTSELVNHEQTRALGIIGKPTGDDLALVGLPLLFNGRRPGPLSAARDVGEDNADLDRLMASRRGRRETQSSGGEAVLDTGIAE